MKIIFKNKTSSISSVLATSETVHPPAPDSYGSQGIFLPPTHATTRQMSNGNNCLLLTNLEPTHPHLCKQGWFHCVAKIRHKACSSQCGYWQETIYSCFFFFCNLRASSATCPRHLQIKINGIYLMPVPPYNR